MQSGSSTRMVFSWPRVQVGRFDCWPGDPRWEAENHVDEGHVIAVPGPAVGIRQEGAEPHVADATRIVLYNAGQTYRRRLLDRSGDHCSFLVVSAELLDELARMGAPITDPERRPFRRTVAAISREDHLEHRALLLLAERVSEGGREAEILELQERLLRHVASLVRPIGAASPPHRTRPRTERRHAELVETAREVLASDLDQPLSLEAVAARVGTSVFHLARLFRARTGLAMHAYRNQLRLRSAVPPVLDGSRPLTEVALDAGYASPSHFTDRFRAAYGLAPSALRRRVLGDESLN